MAPGSAVWEYFTKKPPSVNSTKSVIQCKRCFKDLTYCGSTSSLTNHLKVIHQIEITTLPPTKRAKIQNNSEPLAQSEEADDPASTNSERLKNQSEHAEIVPGPSKICIQKQGSFASGGWRDAEATNALLYMVAHDKMPLCTLEREGFRVFVKKVQHLYRIPSEKTLTKLMENKYEQLKTSIRSTIGEASSLTLTTDLWTETMTMRTFLGVTVHYLKGIEIKSAEIGLKHIRDARSIVNLQIALKEICNEWNVDKRKVTGVTDNGANIKGACKAELGDEKHLSCFAHLINWIGQNAVSSTHIPVGDERQVAAAATENEREVDDGDDDEGGDSEDDGDEDDHNYATTATVTDLKPLFAKIKKIIKFFRSSEKASTELKNLQMSEWKKEENNCLKLIQEVRSRWNSYYEAAERFLHLSDFVSRVLLKCQREKHTTKSKVPDFLTGEELAVMSEVKTLLRPLWQVTKEMSSEKAVTISKCIPIVQSLKWKIEQFPASHGIVFNLKHKLLDAIRERFGRLEEVRLYAISTILDPRYKKFAFEKPQHAAAAISTVGKLVQHKLNSTLQEHAQRQQDQEQPPQERDPDDLWADLDSRIAEQSALLSNQDTPGGLPVELRQYLNMPTCSRTCDPFKEWEHLKQTLPHVYEVARDVLPVLCTSVLSERWPNSHPTAKSP